MSDLTSKIALSTFSHCEGKDEGPMLAEKQGIVSILHTYGRNAKPPMRRTLSADMSSKKWLQQNGLSPMKKLSSSDEQAENPDGSPFAQAKEVENRTRLDIWSSIISKKTQDEGSHLPPPYVHPLVKRSKSSLSVKSLEICTESLGSETGFDGLTPVLPLEVKEVEKMEKQEERREGTQFEELEREGSPGLRTNTNTTKTTPRSFPPPLPSLTRRDGPYLQMHSHREDGRVVLEAVSVPQQNCLQAHRKDGRLLLKLINNPDEAEEAEAAKFENNILDENLVEEETFAEIEKNDDEAGDEEVDDKINSVVFRVQRPVVKMSRMMEMEYIKRKTLHQFINKPMELVGVEEEEPKYLPPPNHELVNAYDYVWRAKPAVASIATDQKFSPPLTDSNNIKIREHKELVLFRGNKEDCLVPFMKVCKDSRRPILNMEAYCIPTS